MEVWAAALHQPAPGHAPHGAQQAPEDAFLGSGTFELRDVLTKAQASPKLTPSLQVLTAAHSCHTHMESRLLGAAIDQVLSLPVRDSASTLQHSCMVLPGCDMAVNGSRASRSGW